MVGPVAIHAMRGAFSGLAELAQSCSSMAWAHHLAHWFSLSFMYGIIRAPFNVGFTPFSVLFAKTTDPCRSPPKYSDYLISTSSTGLGFPGNEDV